MEYRDIRMIHIDASSPEGATRKALAIHRNPNSWVPTLQSVTRKAASKK